MNTVLPPFADHNAVLTRAQSPPIKREPVARTVWIFVQADWTGLNTELEKAEWELMFSYTPDITTTSFTNHILTTAKPYIPTRTIHDSKQSHGHALKHIKGPLNTSSMGP